MPPMRINFVLPEATLAGGVRVVAIYAQRLAERGHRVTVVSMPRRLDWRLRLHRGLRGRGFAKAVAPRTTFFDDLVGVEHRVLDDDRPVVDADLPDADVTVATWWKTAYWVDQLSPSKGGKAYLIQHDERHVHGTAEGVIPTWRLPLRKVLVARWLEPVLREHGVVDALDVVPNAVETAQFHAPPRDKRDRPTVGLMYSDARFKGVDIALAGLERALRQRPDLQVVAFGKHDPYPHLPLPTGTTYHKDPAQDRLREIYAACDGWLFASRCEGFGLPILEAMACRTPVIATPAGAAPELVGQGGGIMVDMEDPDDMARGILQLADTPAAAWRQMSDRAYATAVGYSWDHATDAFEASLRLAAAGDIASPVPEAAGPAALAADPGAEAADPVPTARKESA